jgi:AmmeMemoRadiSam system protein B
MRGARHGPQDISFRVTRQVCRFPTFLLVLEIDMLRPPAVSGRFYTADARELARDIKKYSSNGLGEIEEKVAALGCVVPHAGYMYSGAVAGAVYAAMQIPSKCILIGPRHFPRGEDLAILSEGAWQTPFGEAPIDSEMAKELMVAFPQLREDAIAHEREHSLEVQLPFLQQLGKNVQFVPVLLGTDRYELLEGLGNAIASVVAARREPVLIVASSDMNHYENEVVTRDKDKKAIDRILALDPRGLYDTVRSLGITMCGYAATVAMLAAVLKLTATEAKLVRYATSGDVTGERDEVVGYAGIVLH